MWTRIQTVAAHPLAFSEAPCSSCLGTCQGQAGHSPPSTTGISEWMSPRPAVIHCTPPGPMVPLLPQESWCCILPAGSEAVMSDRLRQCAALQRLRPFQGRRAGALKPWGSHAGTMKCKQSAAVLVAEDTAQSSSRGSSALGTPGWDNELQKILLLCWLQRGTPLKAPAGALKPWGSHAGTMKCKQSAAVLFAEGDATQRSSRGSPALGTPGWDNDLQDSATVLAAKGDAAERSCRRSPALGLSNRDDK